MLTVTRRVALVLLTVGLIFLSSCGTSLPPKGPMPQGVAWTGAWDTTFGPLVLKQEGIRVVGVYKYGQAGIVGALVGEADGNYVNFKWAEQEGGAGTGRGVFVMADDGGSFTGAWGTGDDDRGSGSWEGTRLK
jgi:hypothetical protein